MGMLAVKEKLASGSSDFDDALRIIAVAHLVADLHRESVAANDEVASGRFVYNWNRYYDPRTGRYLSADPVSVGEHTETMVARLRGLGLRGKQLSYATKGLIRAGAAPGFASSSAQQVPYELNPYAYVANNPLRWTDPTGRSAAGGVCDVLGIPSSVCGAAGAVGKGLGGLGLGLMTFSPDAGCTDDEEQDCVEQWRRAYEICAEQQKRGGGRGVTGGHRDEYQCAKGLVSQKCGGNPVE